MHSVFLFFLLIATYIFSKYSHKFQYSSLMLMGIILYYLLIAIGIIPYLLLIPLQSPFIPEKKIEWKKDNVIILLGSGIQNRATLNTFSPTAEADTRIMRAAELYFSCKQEHHCSILISGGITSKFKISEATIYKKIFTSWGINSNDVILEKHSKNTQQNAQFSAEILKNKKFDQFILVTSSTHLRRAILWVNYFGIKTQPVPAEIIHLQPNFYDTGSKFALMDTIVHEYLGIIKFYIDSYFNRWRV